VKLYDFMHAKDLCGEAFTDASWDTWRIIARLYDGDSQLLSAKQKAIAERLLGYDKFEIRPALPTTPPSELYIGAGRRSGKTRFDALLAVHSAAQDYRAEAGGKLAAGEWAGVICTCVDRTQARTWFNYCAGLIDASPTLSAEVTNKTADCIEFAHRTRLEVFTSNFRSVRGFTLALALIDEASFLRDEFSTSPDIELRRALKPALATLNGRLVVTSSLHRKVGLMYNQYKTHFGVAA
jgi:hypothetical protein